MNGLAWFVLNLALLLAAISSRPVMKKLSSPELPPIEQEEKSVRESAKSTRPETALATQPRAEFPDLDDLWKKSLFCPERTESNLLESEAGATPAQAAEKSDFELTGIAWIGRPGAVKPVAVIKQQKAATSRAAVRGRATPVRGRPPTRTAPPVTAEPEKPQNVIFSEGDLINDSGYTLMEINTIENSVILARGAERVELKIEFGSAASSERKSVAVTEAANRQRQREQAAASAAQQARTPEQAAASAAANAAVRASGEPPAPPGAAGTAGGQTGRRRRPRTEGDASGIAESGAGAGGRQTPAQERGGAVPRTQQQRLQQLYRESAERRARSTQ
jgi:hypothetical protein